MFLEIDTIMKTCRLEPGDNKKELKAVIERVWELEREIEGESGGSWGGKRERERERQEDSWQIETKKNMR